MGAAKKICQLQEVMRQRGIDMYIIPTADFHQSEYVGEFFKVREYMTGFTGSAGTAVVTKEEAFLWTDGRYFIQAAKQLEGSGIKLMKSGEPGVPDIFRFLSGNLPKQGCIGFDGRAISVQDGKQYADIAKAKGGHIVYTEDLAGNLWKERPALSKEPAFSLEEHYAGESSASKLERIRKSMKESGASMHILTTLDDICWMLNIRGNDIEFFPLVLSYAVITMESVVLYADQEKFDKKMKLQLKTDSVELRPYNDIYKDVEQIALEETVLLDPQRVNFALYQNLPQNVRKVEKTNPEILFKAVKNPVEIENIRKAQIKDSIAHVRFMKWLKETYAKEEITEMSASRKLDSFREEQEHFLRPSFEPIVSYGEHGAIVHYTSSEETDVPVKEGGFLLTDTGGGYLEGSTDITRTYALGEVTQEMKDYFTLTAVSNLRLADAKFLYGTTGMVLDILARKPFWDRGLNFNHGTGHGVGYLLNIHEGPSGFRWTYREHEMQPLESGMILTDEPGIYFEGRFGIRLENELLVVNGEKNEYGQFMQFETITYVPMDLDAINPDMMTAEDKELLNRYHRSVYETISPYLEEEEQRWLRTYTRAI